mmetsp:Transcript_7881/g.15643  ORF Transcript_7881/g.15643 Transcript_7881/m.15643 type:complete len:269 (+) Transcript_7881:1695-2501(+)
MVQKQTGGHLPCLFTRHSLPPGHGNTRILTLCVISSVRHPWRSPTFLRLVSPNGLLWLYEHFLPPASASPQMAALATLLVSKKFKPAVSGRPLHPGGGGILLLRTEVHPGKQQAHTKSKKECIYSEKVRALTPASVSCIFKLPVPRVLQCIAYEYAQSYPPFYQVERPPCMYHRQCQVFFDTTIHHLRRLSRLTLAYPSRSYSLLFSNPLHYLTSLLSIHLLQTHSTRTLHCSPALSIFCFHFFSSLRTIKLTTTCLQSQVYFYINCV